MFVDDKASEGVAQRNMREVWFAEHPVKLCLGPPAVSGRDLTAAE